MKIRKIASSELMFIDIQSTVNPFAIQSIVELNEDINVDILDSCFNKTIKLCEGSDVCKKVNSGI